MCLLTLSIWEVPDWMSEQQDGKKIIPEAKWDATINALASFLVRARDEFKAPIGTMSFNEADWALTCISRRKRWPLSSNAPCRNSKNAV